MRIASTIVLTLTTLLFSSQASAQLVPVVGSGCIDGAVGTPVTGAGAPTIGNLTFGFEHQCPAAGAAFFIWGLFEPSLPDLFTTPGFNTSCFSFTVAPPSCTFGIQQIYFLSGALTDGTGLASTPFPLPVLTGLDLVTISSAVPGWVVQYICVDGSGNCTGVSNATLFLVQP